MLLYMIPNESDRRGGDHTCFVVQRGSQVYS